MSKGGDPVPALRMCTDLSFQGDLAARNIVMFEKMQDKKNYQLNG